MNIITLKVAMLGNSNIGKTSFMAKYIDNDFQSDYIETIGVNFMDKSIKIKNTEIIFNIWDIGGQSEFKNMLPLVCNETNTILFMFDLTNLNSLYDIKEWYRQARGFNKNAKTMLIGTKYDLFQNLSLDQKNNITKNARKYSLAMKAPLIYCSSKDLTNIKNIFKIILVKNFDLKIPVIINSNVEEPIIEY